MIPDPIDAAAQAVAAHEKLVEELQQASVQIGADNIYKIPGANAQPQFASVTDVLSRDVARLQMHAAGLGLKVADLERRWALLEKLLAGTPLGDALDAVMKL